MHGFDMLALAILGLSGKVGTLVGRALVVGFTRYRCQYLLSVYGYTGINSRHGELRDVGGDISLLLHGFDEFVLNVRGKVETAPRIGLRRVLESDGATITSDGLDEGGGFNGKSHLGVRKGRRLRASIQSVLYG